MTSAATTPPVLDPPLRAWLRDEIGDVRAVRRLVGGRTSEMLHVRTVPPERDLVVRRWSGEREWEPAQVDREVAGLTALADTALGIPRLVTADRDGSASGRPTTVTTFVSGEVDLAPSNPRSWVRQLAETLTRIHDTTPSLTLAPCEVWSRDDLAWLGDDGLAAEAGSLARRAPRAADRVLSHGDYQHFNVLWHRGAVAHVVDWPGVGTASRGLDVGHCRLNLAVLFSADLAMQFLDDYEKVSGITVDPAPDLQRLLSYPDDWPRFIPIQVAGRTTVDGPGMPKRVRETIVRTLRRVR